MNTFNDRTVPTKITIVEFKAYDQTHEKHFFDATADQCSLFIWKKICATAVILNITEYGELSPHCVYGFKKKLTDEELKTLYK